MILRIQNGLELEIFQPQPPEGWDGRQELPHDSVNICAWGNVGLFKEVSEARQNLWSSTCLLGCSSSVSVLFCGLTPILRELHSLLCGLKS